MSKKTKKSSSNQSKNLFHNDYVQLLGFTLIGALLTFFIWRSGYLLKILDAFNLSNGQKISLILKHNQSPIVFYLMIGFTLALIIFLIKLIFVKRKDKGENEQDEKY